MFEFKFGTPKPVKFIEPITEDIEEEVLCRSIGIVKVKEASAYVYVVPQLQANSAGTV